MRDSWKGCEFESTDGLSYAEIRVDPPDPPYPALVHFEPDDFSSLLPDDAKRLAQMLILAAVTADELNRQAFDEPASVAPGADQQETT